MSSLFFVSLCFYDGQCRHLSRELKEEHQDEDDDERVEDRAREDLPELELDDPGIPATVRRVSELLRLVEQRVQVVLVPGKAGKIIIVFITTYPIKFWLKSSLNLP